MAEVYATELGHLSALDDKRLGFAEQMAKGLFWDWAQKSGHATSGSRPALDPHRSVEPCMGADFFALSQAVSLTRVWRLHMLLRACSGVDATACKIALQHQCPDLSTVDNIGGQKT